MAYKINGKTMTEHPLLDEMVYNLNLIMDDIEVKNTKLALKYETEETINASAKWINAYEGNFSFTTYPFEKEELLAYGYSETEASDIVIDKYLIPEESREAVLNFCIQWYYENYEEQNNYYRTLLGLPWIPDDMNRYIRKDFYYVYIDETYITDEYILGMDLFDYSIPVHEFSDYQIQVLIAIGTMDILYEEYNTKYYKYLHFLGDHKVDLYTARKANRFDILYLPSVETLVSRRYKELYLINRDVLLHRYYSEAYKLRNNYYDEMMIILLLCQTYTDMVADVPEWYIRRDVFDLRSCQYFLESNGIAFFKEIPLKYQIRIVKNINKLIRYKSTNQSFWDIIDLFSTDTVTVHEYYIFKKFLEDEGTYELEFVKCPIGDTFDDYIKNNMYREQYDVITYADKWWDGQDTHSYVRDLHLEKNDYTIEGTKFIDIENHISMSEYEYQIEYFVGLLLDSSLDFDDIEISIPNISSILSFSLTDLFILLYCMTASYDDINLLIRVPSNKQYGVKPDFEAYEWYDGTYATKDTEDNGEYFGGDSTTKRNFRKNVNGGWHPEYTEITQETFYNWLAWRYPYLWTDLSNRVNGFNMDADLDELAEIVGFRHSAFGFHRGYTLEELGVDGFLIADKISSIDELMDIYTTNTEIHDNLQDMILNAQTRDEKVVFQFVYDYLFTKSFDYTRYQLSNGEYAETYDEILKERNYVLWRYYNSIQNETDLETRRDILRSDMGDIIDTLSYYLNDDSIQYIFSGFSVTSLRSILYYIYLMINFFRSWKVYFIEMYLTYQLDNKNENTVCMYDGIGWHKNTFWKKNHNYITDTVEVIDEFDVTDKMSDINVEYLDVYGHYESDPNTITDYAGGYIGWEWFLSPFNDYDGGPAEEQTYVVDMDGTYAEVSDEYVVYNGGYIKFDFVNTVMTDLDGGPVEDQDYVLTVNGRYAEGLEYGYPNRAEYYYWLEGGFPGIVEDPSDAGFRVEDTSDPYDVDAGHPEFTSYIPYVMVNGGVEGAGLFTVDLDGSFPIENEFYCNIDGKTADPPREIHTFMPNPANYDAGHPALNAWMSLTMATRIIDKQIESKVIVPDYYKGIPNALESTEYGLFVENKYVLSNDIYDMREEIASLKDTIESYYDVGLDRILLTFSQDYVANRVQDVMDDYLSVPVEVYLDLINNVTLNANKAYTDQKNDELISYLNYQLELNNPYSWASF